jgi:hypothetical protein
VTTIESSPTSVQDYSEAMIRIQHLNKQMHKEIQAKDFDAARHTARKIAVDAMLVGIWCRKFIDETAKNA